MSSTNKTEHYSLPQFIGSDIPTWLGDFNSAMMAIDSGINSAATSASGAATTAAQAVIDAAAAQKSANDALVAAKRCPFPVGFGGFFQADPNTLYEGTKWEQKKDVFILAAGDTYGAGSTGGEAQHILTEAELPKLSGEMNHVIRWNNDPTQSGIISADDENVKFPSTGEGGDGSWTVKIAFGGGQPHNNMPPYFAMPFWIRTA